MGQSEMCMFLCMTASFVHLSLCRLHLLHLQPVHGTHCIWNTAVRGGNPSALKNPILMPKVQGQCSGQGSPMFRALVPSTEGTIKWCLKWASNSRGLCLGNLRHRQPGTVCDLNSEGMQQGAHEASLLAVRWSQPFLVSSQSSHL